MTEKLIDRAMKLICSLPHDYIHHCIATESLICTEIVLFHFVFLNRVHRRSIEWVKNLRILFGRRHGDPVDQNVCCSVASAVGSEIVRHLIWPEHAGGRRINAGCKESQVKDTAADQWQIVNEMAIYRLPGGGILRLKQRRSPGDIYRLSSCSHL